MGIYTYEQVYISIYMYIQYQLLLLTKNLRTISQMSSILKIVYFMLNGSS
jgi:hypothetical protein